MPTPFSLRKALWGPTLLTLLVGLAEAPAAHASGRKKSSQRRAKVRMAETESKAESKQQPSKSKGGLEQERQVLSRRIRAGANLSGAQLAFTDLSNLDLRGTDFRRADLIGANFQGSDLTGALFAGARISGADFHGANGLDWKEAEVHPFFEVRARDPLGSLRFHDLTPASLKLGTPRDLLFSADGQLFWINDMAGAFCHLSPSGSLRHFATGDKRPMLGLVKDPTDHLWFFMDHCSGRLDLKTYCTSMDTAREQFRDLPAWISAEPSDILCAGNRQRFDLMLLHPTRMMVLKVDARDIRPEPYAIDDTPGVRGAVNREGSLLALASKAPKGADLPARLTLMRLPELKATQSLELPKGMEPGALAFAGDGKLWLICGETLACVEIADGKAPLRLLQGAAGILKEPSAIICGPDGNPWFADRGTGRIGRMRADGVLQSWALPAGARPLKLYPGPDGRLLFTLEGTSRIGSIQALEPAKAKAEAKAEAKGDAKAEGAATPTGFEPEHYAYKPAPGPAPGPSKAERWARHAALVKRAEENHLSRLAELVPGPEPRAQAEAAAESKVERKAAAKPHADGGPTEGGPTEAGRTQVRATWQILDDLRVAIPAKALAHILAQHTSGEDPDKSRFHADYHTPAALTRLIAEGLAEAGDLGREIADRGAGTLGALTDPYGLFKTRIPWPGVGTVRNWGRQEPTNTLTVVTRRSRNPETGAWEHAVVSAYPDWDDW